MRDRFQEVAAVVMEMRGFEGSTLLRAEHVVEAMELLSRAGYAVLLLPAGTTVRLGEPSTSRRRWWRGRRNGGHEVRT